MRIKHHDQQNQFDAVAALCRCGCDQRKRQSIHAAKWSHEAAAHGSEATRQISISMPVQSREVSSAGVAPMIARSGYRFSLQGL